MEKNYIHKNFSVCYNQLSSLKRCEFGVNRLSKDIKIKRQRLFALLKTEAFEFGEVILSSGAKSDYYFDGKMVTLSAEGAFLVASVILDSIKETNVDAIGGLTMGADPIAGAISALSYEIGNPIKSFIVRKEPKKHGKKKWIEGPLLSGDKVIIVDDVVTTGNSIIDAIKKVEEFGCTVIKIIALVDRLEGGFENLKKNGYELEHIFTADDFKVKELTNARTKG